MSRSHNPLKAGLFILVSIALAVAIFFGIAGSTMILGPTRDYVAEFTLADDVSGLSDGNDVRIGGVKVGTVRAVEILTDGDAPKIRVRFRVPAKYELRDGAAVAVQTGLTGLVNLNVSNLGKGSPIPPTQPIAGIGSPLNRAIASLGDAGPTVALAMNDVRTVTLPKVNTALDSANATLTTGNAAADQIRVAARSADETIQLIKSKIDPMVERYNKVADTAGSVMGHLDEVFGQSKLDLKTSIANLEDFTGTAKEKLPPLMDKLTTTVDGLKGTIDKTNAMLGDVKTTIENTRDATGGVKSILANNRSRIDEIIKSLGTTSSNLGFASSEIRRSPWRLLYKPSDGEVNNQNLYDSARQFAEGATKLQDSAAALRDLLDDPKADPAKVQALVGDLDSSFQKFEQIEKKLWEQVRK